MRDAPVCKDAILIVSYGGGHAAALAPVARRLLVGGHKVAILGLTTARAYFERQGLTSIGMADLLGAVPGYAEAAEIGAALAGGQPPHAAVSRRETEAYLGVGYHALVRELGAAEADGRYRRLGRQAFRPFEFFQRLFEAGRPAAVVATSAPRAERAAIEAASAAGIPSLCVVDLYAPFEIEWCAADGFADRICVLNDAVATRFRERGVPAERITVTGNPAFDRLGTVDVEARRRSHRERTGLCDGDRLILWISQPEPAVHPFSGVAGDPDLPLQIERHLASAFADDETVHITMRLHPSEDRSLAASGPRIRKSGPDEPLDDLLCAADCVVTTSSTVGLEAALLGTPVVQINNSIFSPDLPLADLGFAMAASNHYQAVRSIRDVLEGGGGHRRRMRPPATFDATARVSHQIISLL